MDDISPEVRKFVETYVFITLDSLRSSHELEDRYHDLSRQMKSATTTELHKYAKVAADHLLANISDIGELGETDDDSAIREALMKALADRS